MFGIKFRTWMESHIVRPRKKRIKEEGNKIVQKNSKIGTEEPISEQTVSKKPEQVLRNGTTSDMEPISLDVSLEAGNNLSSPESAYSTGYSTDGTSPGHPPEYYINIRTGTHYFLPNSAATTAPPVVVPKCTLQETCPHLSKPTASPVHQLESKRYTNNLNTGPPKVASPQVRHRRTESCGECHYGPAAPLPLLTASPRQRNRIRTNPWLPSNPRTCLPSEATEPCGGSVGGSVGGPEVRRLDDKMSPDNESDTTSSTSSIPTSNIGDLTDDDLTLNEMMGKFDESYVYEKETDILSDSDPTDCEETDFETGRDGGDEQDTHDEEELDFIDNGSLIDLPTGTDNDKIPSSINKGHCTYHDFIKKPRYRESVYRRSSTRGKEEKESPVLRRPSFRKEHFFRRMGSREGSKFRKQDSSDGHSSHSSQSYKRSGSDKKRTRNSVRKSVRERNLQPKIQVESNVPVLSNHINDGEIKCETMLNFNRILINKVLERGHVGGTRSAGNTPVSLRKRVLTNELCSPKKDALIIGKQPLEPLWLNENIQKRRSNSVSYARNNVENGLCGKQITAFVSEMALIEADKEADLKYKELIMEAENIILTIKDQMPKPLSNVIPKPKPIMRAIDCRNDQYPFKEEQKLLRKAATEKNDPCPRTILRTSPDIFGESSTSVAQNDSCIKNSPKPCRRATATKSSPVQPQNQTNDSFTPKVTKLFKPEESTSMSKFEKSLQNSTVYEKIYNTENDCRQKCYSQDDEFILLARRSPKEKRVHVKPSNIKMDISKVIESNGTKNVNQSKSTNKIDNMYGKSVPGKLSDLTKKLNIPVTTEKSPVTVSVTRPPLVAFRSVDLGNELDNSNYCPQSEPVKRKVYSCSLSYDRLQKSLAEKGNNTAKQKPDTDQDNNSRNILREKLKQLRERDEKEEQSLQQLALFRRQMLVSTIEGLKRSLQDQSAKLKATYCSDEIDTS